MPLSDDSSHFPTTKPHGEVVICKPVPGADGPDGARKIFAQASASHVILAACQTFQVRRRFTSLRRFLIRLAGPQPSQFALAAAFIIGELAPALTKPELASYDLIHCQHCGFLLHGDDGVSLGSCSCLVGQRIFDAILDAQ